LCGNFRKQHGHCRRSTCSYRFYTRTWIEKNSVCVHTIVVSANAWRCQHIDHCCGKFRLCACFYLALKCASEKHRVLCFPDLLSGNEQTLSDSVYVHVSTREVETSDGIVKLSSCDCGATRNSTARIYTCSKPQSAMTLTSTALLQELDAIGIPCTHCQVAGAFNVQGLLHSDPNSPVLLNSRHTAVSVLSQELGRCVCFFVDGKWKCSKCKRQCAHTDAISASLLSMPLELADTIQDSLHTSLVQKSDFPCPTFKLDLFEPPDFMKIATTARLMHGLSSMKGPFAPVVPVCTCGVGQMADRDGKDEKTDTQCVCGSTCSCGSAWSDALVDDGPVRVIVSVILFKCMNSVRCFTLAALCCCRQLYAAVQIILRVPMFCAGTRCQQRACAHQLQLPSRLKSLLALSSALL
jgi:hypothetical protein